MQLAFMDRQREIQRLVRALNRDESTLTVLYGRRRLGKSRLVREALRDRPALFHVCDERAAALQRESLASAAAAFVPGFDAVRYPDWHALLQRWWRDAPAGLVLAIDEFPRLVMQSPELPSVLQNLLDDASPAARHVVLTGSAQSMMQGLVLDSSAPLFGRAREIMAIRPLPIWWLHKALELRDAAEAVAHWAVWGGVPRYWELAREHRTRVAAITDLVLDPLGVLHNEPEQILTDDMVEVTRASSLLALVGRGVCRVSEMGARLGVAATSLSRPLSRLLDLGLLTREVPFGRSAKDTKQSWYRIADPLLRFWYRFVDPNRSRLALGHAEAVAKEVAATWPQYLGQVWEDLARESASRLAIGGTRFGPASRWWGRGTDGADLELDVMAESADGKLLVGEARSRCKVRELPRLLTELEGKIARCPVVVGRSVVRALWILDLQGRGRRPAGLTVFRAKDVVDSLQD